MCHSVNDAIFSAFEKRIISSASIMPPCEWFWEAAKIASQKRDLDIGVHLTFTSEWTSCRWRPLSCSNRDSGLVDDCGAFPRTAHEISASSETIRTEVLAQVRLCLQSGVVPTHLDSHMFALYHKDRISAYIEAATMLDIPYLIPHWRTHKSAIAKNHPSCSRIIDNLIAAPHDLRASAWEEFYVDQLNNLKPGINELLVHPGFDTPELRTMAGRDTPWGAEWRQRDYDVLMSQGFNEALDRNQIKVISWANVRRITAGNY
jgi:hypothetical protein